jgi:hypothetical protein
MGAGVLTPVQVREALERAERRFGEVCISATEEQWHFQPIGTGDKAWTMPHVVEHVATGNQGVLQMMQLIVVSSPRGDQAPEFDDEDMPYIFYGGGGAPPPGLPEPSGTWSKDESVSAFQESMRALVDWCDGVDVDLRECAVAHPAFGLFDGAQWLLFQAVHAQQHRGQLLDLKRASDSAQSAAT